MRRSVKVGLGAAAFLGLAIFGTPPFERAIGYREPLTAAAGMPTAGETDYLGRVQPLVAYTADDLDTLDGLMARAAADPTLLRQRPWEDRDLAAVSVLMADTAKLREPRAVPPRLAGLDADVVREGEELDAFMLAYLDATDGLDAADFAAADRHLQAATAAMHDAQRRLAELGR